MNGRVHVAVRTLAPAVILLLVVLSDLALKRQAVVLGLFVIAPLVAATLVGAGLTAVYAVLALAAAALLGVWDGVYVAGPEGDAQLIRLVGVFLGGVIAVVTARLRLNREVRLAQVTRVAEVAQLAVLEPVPEQLGPVEIAVRYDSSASEATVGGDLYAALQTPVGVRILVGDVRGKGLDAVRLASRVLGTFRERAPEREQLTELAADLARTVERAGGPEDFVTAVLAQISDDGVLEIVNAGHPPPLLVSGQTVLELQASQAGPPLGVPGPPSRLTVALERSDRVLLYTDGLSEARRRHDRAFFDVLAAVSVALTDRAVAAGLDELHRELVRWTGDELHDDVALVAFTWQPVA